MTAVLANGGVYLKEKLLLQLWASKGTAWLNADHVCRR
jgi:hypothetical protein